MTALLSVQDIHTYYGDSYVLQGLSLEVEKGEALGILGRNGMGKTTLINSIMGFVPPRQGKILFRGKLERRMETLERTLDERLDPRLSFSAEVTVDL